MRVRGNAHQVFDKYQSLAREAASSGDRILAEAYYQYADHYYRVIQSMGGFVQRSNQGWGEGGEDGQQQGQQPGQPQQGQGGPQSGDGGDAPTGERGEQGASEYRTSENRTSENRTSENRSSDSRQGGEPRQSSNYRQNDRRQNDHRENSRERDRDHDEAEPGLNGVAFLQNGRTAPGGSDPAVEEQPEVPEFVPATGSRRA